MGHALALEAPQPSSAGGGASSSSSGGEGEAGPSGARRDSSTALREQNAELHEAVTAAREAAERAQADLEAIPAFLRGLFSGDLATMCGR